ncbi:MAG: T9SS type A sorting domain-containing protein [Saprospiraceae bacterium]|nr:T9SS type A sorting domain-containing protein [Saprospiraceae bacterium]
MNEIIFDRNAEDITKLIPRKTHTIHSTVKFTFPSDYFQYGGRWMSFNSGGSPQFVTGSITITYSSPGVKELRNYYQGPSDNNPALLSSFTLKAANAAYAPPDDVWEINSTETWLPNCAAYSDASANTDNTVSTASAYIKYGSGHTSLVKPIIFVDGLDFSETEYKDPSSNKVIRHGATGWDVLVMGAEESFLEQGEEETFKLYPETFQTLRTQGYDVIFLDFTSGSDYIQKNALLLKALIQRINREKTGDNQGIVHENVVVGASMGGQIARYCLAAMEQNGEDHCTHTYVSFDSPHKGATIPLGIQAMAYYADKAGIASGDNSFWLKLNKPAPRQLLIEHIGSLMKSGKMTQYTWAHGQGISNDFNDNYDCLRINYLNELTTLGYPKQTRNIAVACGSETNALQNAGTLNEAKLLEANAIVYNMGLPVARVFQFNLWAAKGGTFNDGVEYMDECFIETSTENASNLLFSAAIPTTFTGLCGSSIGDFPQYYTSSSFRYANANNGIHFENAPGGYRADLVGIKNLLDEQLGASTGRFYNIVNGYTVDLPASKKRQCFIPTMSALDIDMPMNEANLYLNLKDYILQNPHKNPFKSYFAVNENNSNGGLNLKHVEINTTIKNWVSTEISKGGNELALSLPVSAAKKIYNFGGTRNKMGSVNINQGGELYINNCNTYSGYIEDPNQRVMAIPMASFDVYTTGCGTAQVNVNTGGYLYIGAAGVCNQKGILHITSGNTLHIKSGGTLRVIGASQLIIESGGKLVIDAGAIVQLWDGQQSNGQAKIHIRDGGELVVNGNFNFSGNGYFHFDGLATFTLNAPSLEMEGHAKDCRLFSLGGGFEMTFTDKVLRLGNCAIESGSGSIFLNSGARGIFNDMEFRPINNVGNSGAKIITANGAARIYVENSVFKHLEGGVYAFNMGEYIAGLPPISVINCAFTDVNLGVSGNNVPKIQVLGSTFSGGGTAGIRAYNVGKVFVHNCQVSGYTRPMPSVSEGELLTGGLYPSGIAVNTRYINTQHAFEDIEIINRTTELTLVNTSVNNCNVGVDAVSRTNFFGSGGTTLSNNVVGICMKGGKMPFPIEDYGALHLDCSKVLDNTKFGIFGKNIWLNIDELQNSDGVRANHFRASTQVNSYMMRLLYEYPYSCPPGFSARGNYWENVSFVYPNTANEIVRVSANCSISPNSNAIPLNTYPRAAAAPTECKLGPIGGGGGEGIVGEFSNCDVTRQSEIVAVDDRFLAANRTMFRSLAEGGEITDEIRQNFAKTSSITTAEYGILGNTCKIMTDVSKTLIKASAQGLEANPESFREQNGIKYQLFPNPLTDYFFVKVEQEGDYTLQIFDILSRSIYTRSFDAVLEVETPNWQSGIYTIMLTDNKTGQYVSHKICVQRL